MPGATWLHCVAQGLACRPGDNIVVAGSEFPSVLHIWQANGFKLNRVGTGPVPSLEEYAAAIDEKTRAIVVSRASYLSGARADLSALRELADRHSLRLVVDASHSLGVVSVDGALCDAVVSSCYKWLLATHGVGVFFVNKARWPELQPTAVGWNGVVNEPDWRQRTDYELKPTLAKFEGGNPSFIAVYYLDNSLARLSEVEVTSLEAHVLRLGEYLMSALKDLGANMLTPEAATARAGNICIATPRSEHLEVSLRNQGVVTWGGDGRLRISIHAYNDENDIDRLLTAMKSLRSDF